MKRESVLFHNEDEYVVMEEDGYCLIVEIDHFKQKFWYTVKFPDETYANFFTFDIYEAIDMLNYYKENGIGV